MRWTTWGSAHDALTSENILGKIRAMNDLNVIRVSKAVVLVSLLGLSGCSSTGVVNGVVNTTGFVAKTAVNGTIGAGKVVARGVTGSEDE